MVRVPFTEMQRVIRAAFVRAGMNEPDADLCAPIHTESTCDGVNSHGLNRCHAALNSRNMSWRVTMLHLNPGIRRVFCT
jgi:3-dehydro-L-gulonate 2-dehydrogenase